MATNCEERLEREIWFNKMCKKAKELYNVLWRRFEGHISQLAHERYKRGKNEYSKLKEEEEKL